MKFFDEIDEDLMRIKRYRSKYNILKKLYIKVIYPILLKIKITNRIRLHNERIEKDVIVYGKMIDCSMVTILREYVDIISRYRLKRVSDRIQVVFIDQNSFSVKILVTSEKNITIIYHVQSLTDKSASLKIMADSKYINTSTFSGLLDKEKRLAEFITLEELYRDLEYRINEYIDILC